MPELRILHLYPQTLKLNGEAGNVLALQTRATASGLSVRVSTVELGQELPVKRPSIIFIGSGTLSATKAAHGDLVRHDRQIHRWLAEGTKVLAVGAGFDLISQGLELADGSHLAGLGLTNTSHRETKEYLVGEVKLSGELAGFINWNREIIRGAEGFELGRVLASDNRSLVDYLDGYSDGKVLASNVQGPLLPMNPKLAELLISWVFPEISKTKGNSKFDRLAKQARDSIYGRIGR
jgi:CobQ-like glutamine amidotransferase family enzyme